MLWASAFFFANINLQINIIRFNARYVLYRKSKQPSFVRWLFWLTVLIKLFSGWL